MSTRFGSRFSIAIGLMLIVVAFLVAPARAASTKAAVTARRAQAMYQKRMYDEAFKIALPLAESGDPSAQALVAEMYSLGRGTKSSSTASIHWYRKSAEGGSAFGQNAFAGLLMNGTNGLPQDRIEAYKYLARARIQDSRTATDPMTNIGASAASLNLDTLNDVMTKDGIHEALARAFPNPNAYGALVAAHLKDTESSDQDIRGRAITNLGVMGKFGVLGSETGAVVTRLIDILHSDANKNHAVSPALEKIGAPAVPALIILLDDKNHVVRSDAKMTLKAIGTPEALAALERHEP